MKAPGRAKRTTFLFAHSGGKVSCARHGEDRALVKMITILKVWDWDTYAQKPSKAGSCHRS